MGLADPPRKLVVIGDSLAFTNDTGPQLPEEPTLYPNRLRAVLAQATAQPWEVRVLARPGAGVRDAWGWVAKERHTQFDLIADADAVVVAIGSFDHAPLGVPAMIEAVIPFVRPALARRWLRRGARALHPLVARVSRSPRTPTSEFLRLYDLLLRQVRGLTKGASGVVLGTTLHRSNYYGGLGGRHPGWVERETAQFQLAERHGFATVSCYPLVEPFADRLNPDGIHWPAGAHAAVAGALAAPLIEQLEGRRPKPSWYDSGGD
jgi:diglucosylglycerate octanoyltransferase